MERHCFAVWDFMSLLKFLQRCLSCVDLPWRPVGDPKSRRLVNEIVLGEESDEDGRGGYCSHFELYLAAMRDCGADTSKIERFLLAIEDGRPISIALEHAGAPPESKAFVQSTWAILQSESLPSVVAAFAFGREDVVPEMFRKLVESLLHRAPDRWSRFLYYLNRHIQLDGELHGPLSEKLLANVCGENLSAWQEAETAAKEALSARSRFWDAVQLSLKKSSRCLARHERF